MNLLAEAAPYVAPALLVIGGARWAAGFLWTRFDRKLNENRDTIMNRLAEMHSSQVAQDARLDGHDERLAWLEGNAGQPLHSIRSTRKTAPE